MWKASVKESTDTNTKFGLIEEHTPVTQRRFLELLRASRQFRTFYTNFLADCPYEAFLWENKPLTRQRMGESYGCNLIANQYLAGRSPDPVTFSEYFEEDKNVVTFPNLGSDARLIVSCPRQDHAIYPHIGTFVRNSCEDQLHDFWRITAEQMFAALGKEPRWLSTSGLGVIWLHARIDSHPKYYQTREYKQG